MLYLIATAEKFKFKFNFFTFIVCCMLLFIVCCILNCWILDHMVFLFVIQKLRRRMN